MSDELELVDVLLEWAIEDDVHWWGWAPYSGFRQELLASLIEKLKMGDPETTKELVKLIVKRLEQCSEHFVIGRTK